MTRSVVFKLSPSVSLIRKKQTKSSKLYTVLVPGSEDKNVTTGIKVGTLDPNIVESRSDILISSSLLFFSLSYAHTKQYSFQGSLTTDCEQ